MKRFSFLLSLLLCSMMVFADLPFRDHRYDAFKMLPVKENHIVFIGNSITNMHEWWEAFGSNPNIINRGVSGALSKEALEHVEAVIAGKPAKVFLMIGTNDIGTPGLNSPEQIVNQVRQMVDRFQKESPKTQLYIQSILPSKVGIRTLELEKNTNKALARLCAEKQITYIDLWQDLLCVSNHENTLDGLHLMAAGYEIWCKKIQQYVGTNSVYPADTKSRQNTGNAQGSWGMRNTYFSMYPVKNTDILVIGDEMIHGGEWHELLQSPRVKNRGTGWGYPGPSLDHSLNAIPAILHEGQPAKICLYAGVADVNNTNNDLNAVFGKYNSIVKKIRTLAPQTKIYVMGLQPTNNARLNQRVVEFNNKLQTLAQTEYIDLYTDFVKEGEADSKYFKGNYLYGMGYIKVAEKMAEALKESDIKAFPRTEAEKIYQRYAERTALGNAINQAAQLREGDAVGEYPTAMLTPLKAQIEKAYKLLREGGTPTAYQTMGEDLRNQVKKVLPQLNMPLLSHGTKEYWYKLSTPLRQGRYLTSHAANTPIVGEPKHNFATCMWKFVARNDGKVDMVNRDNHAYMNPVAAYNSAITTSVSAPANGWDLSYSNTAGLFIVHSGKVQLNQTDEQWDYQLFNWSTGQSGDDRNDVGCQFRIEDAGEADTVVHEDNQIMSASQITNGWYQVKAVGGTHADMKSAIQKGLEYIQTVNSEYRQTADFYYPLKYGALDETKPATAYVYITRDKNAFYFTALNGHAVEENCTASRKVPHTKTSISGGNGEFIIGHWTAFNAKDGQEWPYVGKFSSQTATYKIYKVDDSKLNGFDCYQVNISGVKNEAEIGQDVQLTCNHAALQSVASVYDGGYFFVKKGTPLSPTDFKATPKQGKKVEITIQDNTISVKYSSGQYALVSEQIELASAILENTAEGTNPGCFSKESRSALKAALQKAMSFNSTAGKTETEIAAAVTEMMVALENYREARIDVSYSTEGHESWYYIVSASTLAYCQDKYMMATENGPLTYAEKQLNPNMVWSFWKDENGKVAIRSYAGKYIGKIQDKGNAHAGMSSTAEPNYTLALWEGLSNHQCAYTLQSDASEHPLHAQQDGTVIVTWKANDNNASLWNLVQVSADDLNSKIQFTGKVEQVQVTTGIGNKEVCLLRMHFALNGLNGTMALNGFKGTVHHATAVSAVRIYQSENAFEYRTGKSDAKLMGSANVGPDGTFDIRLAQSLTLSIGDNPYFWLVADINEKAREGDVIDPEITAYVIDGEDKIEEKGNPEHHTTVFLSASTVEYLNTNDSRYYRIPAIATALNGWLVSVADKRFNSNADLPNNIDVVARVSKDCGKTWTEPVVIAGTPDLGGDYGHGDPAIVTDRVTGDIIVLVTSKVGFFYGRPDNCPHIKMIASHDHGLTWDAPVDITHSLYGAECPDPVRKNYHSLFVSSGAFMQTRAGVLMAVAPVRETASTNHGDFTAHVIYSEDHGKTWSMSNVIALKDADESKIVELDNGDLMIKSRKGGHPYYVISKDGGKTWSPKKQWTDVTDPNCNGDLIRYTSLSNGDLKNRLLASIPHATDRSNVSVFISYDEGMTWPIHKSICPKGSGYSSMTVLPDHTVGCYFEEDGLEGGYQLRYVRFSLDGLSNGTDRIYTKEEYKKDLMDKAHAALERKGVGYPALHADCRNTLQRAIRDFEQVPAATADFAQMEAAVWAYKNSTADIQMPESGKAYTFTNVAQDGTLQYLNYSSEGMNWVTDKEKATAFVCKNDNGQFAFVNNDGRYLEWFGIHNTHSDNKGYSETFDQTWNYFTVSKLVKGKFVNAGSNASLFGYVYLMGKRLRDGKINDVAFVISKNNGKNGATEPFFNNDFSSAMLMTEVPYANVVEPEPAHQVQGVDYMTTFSAPFPTVIPEGVNAFYAVADSEEKDHVNMMPVEGTTMLGGEGYIITTHNDQAVTFVPATGESAPESVTGNLLKASAGVDKAMDTVENAWVLTNKGEKVAFYKAEPGFLLPMNRAYLISDSQTEVITLRFSDEITGISPLIENTFDKNSIYDLSGRKLNVLPKKGIFIYKGKKIFRK